MMICDRPKATLHVLCKLPFVARNQARFKVLLPEVDFDYGTQHFISFCALSFLLNIL